MSKKRKIILLIITGIASIVALDGLSQIYQDYYVSAALSRAIFTAILLFVILSPFYFLESKDLGESLKRLLKKVGDRILLIITALVISLFIAWVLISLFVK